MDFGFGEILKGIEKGVEKKHATIVKVSPIWSALSSKLPLHCSHLTVEKLEQGRLLIHTESSCCQFELMQIYKRKIIRHLQRKGFKIYEMDVRLVSKISTQAERTQQRKEERAA